LPQKGRARLHLVCLGSTIAGRAALHQITNVNVAALQTQHVLNDSIEEVPRLTEKGDALEVLILPGARPYEHDIRLLVATANNYLSAPMM
jgi:hypothetical protein